MRTAFLSLLLLAAPGPLVADWNGWYTDLNGVWTRDLSDTVGDGENCGGFIYHKADGLWWRDGEAYHRYRHQIAERAYDGTGRLAWRVVERNRWEWVRGAKRTRTAA